MNYDTYDCLKWQFNNLAGIGCCSAIEERRESVSRKQVVSKRLKSLRGTDDSLISVATGKAEVLITDPEIFLRLPRVAAVVQPQRLDKGYWHLTGGHEKPIFFSFSLPNTLSTGASPFHPLIALKLDNGRVLMVLHRPHQSSNSSR